MNSDATPARAASFLPEEPTQDFPYRILGKVGEGGMGEVFQAEDVELGRFVAIKVIRVAQFAILPPREARDTLQRFLQEARAAAALSHAGVTTVHRVGTVGGWPYIAMEWLDGETLEERLIERKRLSVDETARIGLEVLAVLSAAHELGIVHRDIKPGNLMLLRDGHIKVTDFGIARVQGSDLAQTQPGVLLGTPWYAAPEQLSGQAVDCRADLYSLACVLYECVAGRPPFEEPSLYQLLHAVHVQRPNAPSVYVPGIPPGFDAALVTALAKRPEDRYASAQVMAAAIQPYMTIPAAPTAGTSVGPTEPRPALAPVATMVIAAPTPHALVAGLVKSWPARALGRWQTSSLLSQLQERPFHAPAFCGALSLSGALLLLCDGIIYGAVDIETGNTGDPVLESLPAAAEATIHLLPKGMELRLIPLLASALLAPSPRMANLDACFTNLPLLAGKLASEGFDGALRFVHGAHVGFSFFSKGRRALDLFSDGWTPASRDARWEEWVAGSGAVASVEELRISFPAMTFRQQLKDVPLEIVRPSPDRSPSIRADAVSEAQALHLRPRDTARLQLRRGESTLRALIEADPAHSLLHWVLTSLAPQFAHHGRTGRWRALLDPLPYLVEVCLHHAVPCLDGTTISFDGATYGADGRLHHLIDRVRSGTKQTVQRFFERVLAAKEARQLRGELGGAILVAPRFDEEALAAYLKELQARDRPSLLSGIDALAHREGFVRLAGHGGIHVLLVEEDGGRRRPLVPDWS